MQAHMPIRPAMVVVTLMLVGLASCDDDDPTGPPLPVASVEVSPSERNLVMGETLRLTATPKDASGRPLGGRAVTWTSDKEGVAMVSATGTVRGIAPGTANVSATSEGKRGSARITVIVTSAAMVR
jgi:uncharacterized protein YjdB